MQDLVALRPDSVTLLRIMSGYAINERRPGLQAGDMPASPMTLEPDSPVVIETLAGAWESVGVTDKAERLLLDGLEIAGDNFGLQTNYFFLLLKQGRLEKAERLLVEQFGDSMRNCLNNCNNIIIFKKA